MKLRRLFSLTTLVLLAAPLLAHAQPGPRYKVTPVAGAGSWASDINCAGQVAGTMYVSNAKHAFLFTNGTLTDIGALTAGQTTAARMNDLGQVVGSIGSINEGGTGFIYGNGVLTPLIETVSASGINNAGAITGWARVSPNPDEWWPVHAFIRSASGEFTDLGTLPGQTFSLGYDINSAGHVVGQAQVGGAPNDPANPMLYRDGVMIDLAGADFGWPPGFATAINDHDQVVGVVGVYSSSTPSWWYRPRIAFLYQDGVLTLLPGFGPNRSSRANDINSRGQIVGGGFVDVEETTSHAFLFENGATLDLNALIDPASGWVIDGAAAINDLGQIAGHACKDGNCYAVRLDPRGHGAGGRGHDAAGRGNPHAACSSASRLTSASL